MRGYEQFLGDLFTRVSPAVVLVILLAVTGLIAAGWYYFPAWVPRRLPRLRRPRVRMPRFSPRPRKAKPLVVSRREPDVAVVPAGRADELAGQGRYAEAIRERLRDTVADLTRAGLIDPEPGATAAELAGDAIAGRPGVGPALTGATGLFSGVWYGRQPAGPHEDARMRELTAEVRDGLAVEEGR